MTTTDPLLAEQDYSVSEFENLDPEEQQQYLQTVTARVQNSIVAIEWVLTNLANTVPEDLSVPDDAQSVPAADVGGEAWLERIADETGDDSVATALAATAVRMQKKVTTLRRHAQRLVTVMEDMDDDSTPPRAFQ